MHLKRNKSPKNWPLKRKGTKFLVRTSHNLENSVPLLIILRDVLKLVENKKEVQKLINQKIIKINNKLVRDVKYPLNLFDILSLSNKNFRVIIENKKFNIKEISESESKEKIEKITGKKIIKNKKQQINLSNGKNILSQEKTKTGDSALIDLEKNKIKKILPLKKSAKIFFTTGKHIGQEGEIEDIQEKKLIVKLDKEKINTKINSIIVIG